MTVLIKIQDAAGTEIGAFQAEDEKSLAEMAAMHGIEILQSCSTGFCGVCLCDVVEGAPLLQKDKTWDPLYDLATDEDGNLKQVLACIGGIKSEFFTDDAEHVVVLKKAY